MKRFLLILLCAMICGVSCACVMGDGGEGLVEGTSDAFDNVESEGVESEGVESDESPSGETDFFLDFTLDLLPLFPNPDRDPDYEDKINSFLNFVMDEFGEDALKGVYLDIKKYGYSDEIWIDRTGNSISVLETLFRGEENDESVRIISLGSTKDEGKRTVMTFGGDVCFADNYATMPYMLRKGKGLAYCFAEEWFDIMRSADVAMVNNEFSISDRGSPMKHKTYTYVAKPEHTKYYGELGIDFVTLANNHVFDYGEDAFYDTLDTLDEYGIDYAGAGRNARDAQKPFYYVINGRKIGFISATRAEKNILTPEATEGSPGVFRCYDNERLLEVIAETEEECDFLVLFLHWGTEYSPKLERVQKTTSHEYVDAGADLIIGTHAHMLQGIEFYNGKAIFYNLGNFWFNAKTIETGLVKLELDGDGNAEYYFIPGMQAGCKVSYELGTETGRMIFDHLESYEDGIVIDDDGRVRPEN
ncbi:MAG: CapA family protein [Clostridia bacterium]|nr:CapA family protein [Clostridia bacterium]